MSAWPPEWWKDTSLSPLGAATPHRHPRQRPALSQRFPSAKGDELESEVIDPARITNEGAPRALLAPLPKSAPWYLRLLHWFGLAFVGQR